MACNNNELIWSKMSFSYQNFQGTLNAAHPTKNKPSVTEHHNIEADAKQFYFGCISKVKVLRKGLQRALRTTDERTFLNLHNVTLIKVNVKYRQRYCFFFHSQTWMLHIMRCLLGFLLDSNLQTYFFTFNCRVVIEVHV